MSRVQTKRKDDRVTLVLNAVDELAEAIKELTASITRMQMSNYTLALEELSRGSNHVQKAMGYVIQVENDLKNR